VVYLKTKEMIVLKDFYCTHTNVSYKAGDVYKGNRTDISYLLEGEIEIDYVEVTPKKATKKRK